MRQLKKIISHGGSVTFWELVGKRWQRVSQFSAVCGLKTGYYKLMTSKLRTHKCSGCGGGPTVRDRETNGGKLCKWPVVVTSADGGKTIVWSKLCSKCLLGDVSDDDWAAFDRSYSAAQNGPRHPLADIQGVNLEFPKFTKEEREKIDKFMIENGLAFDHDGQKNWMFAGAKK